MSYNIITCNIVKEKNNGSWKIHAWNTAGTKLRVLPTLVFKRISGSIYMIICIMVLLVFQPYTFTVCAHIRDWISNVWISLDSTGSDNSALLEVNGEYIAACFRLKLFSARKRAQENAFIVSKYFLSNKHDILSLEALYAEGHIITYIAQSQAFIGILWWSYIQYIPRNMLTVLLCFALLWLCNRS